MRFRSLSARSRSSSSSKKKKKEKKKKKKEEKKKNKKKKKKKKKEEKKKVKIVAHTLNKNKITMSRFKLTKKDQEWSKEMVSLTCREALNSAYVQLLDNHPATEHVSREAVERIRDFSQSKHCFTLPNDSGGGGGGEGGGGGGGMTSSFSFSSSAAVSCYSSSSSASALVQLSTEPLLFHTSATLKLKFLLSSFQKCLILGVRTLFSDQLTAETAFINSSELLNVVLNVVAAELSFATSEEFNHSAAPESESEKESAGAASTRKKGFCQLVGNPPPPAFLTGQTVGELYQETVLFVCSRNKAGSDAVENAEEAEEMLQLSKEYARHTLVLLVSLGLAANQMSAAAIYKLLLELVAEIVLAKKLNFDRESEERARRNIATSESDDSSSSSLSSEEEEEDNNDDSSSTSTDEETSRHHLAAARKETKKMV